MRTFRFVDSVRAAIAAAAGFAALCCVASLMAVLFACSTSPKPVGGLMLILDTDLSTPDDFNVMRLEISEQSVPGGTWNSLYKKDYLIPNEATLPTTYALLSRGNAEQQALIRVSALDMSGQPVVIREAQVLVPTTRVAELRLVLARRCVGQLMCPGGESCQPDTGACGSSFINPLALPTFKPQDVDSGSLPRIAGSGIDDAGGPEAEASAEESGPSPEFDATTLPDAVSSGDTGAVAKGDAMTGCTVSGQCVVQCADTTKHTTLSGTVYDPAGNNPLPNIAVYVPATLPLAPLPKGAACGDCASLYKGIVLTSAITGADGSFTLIDPPAGPSVPVVVQAGKWRAVYSATISQCKDNIPSQTLKLPKNASVTMSASLPDVAISTGGLDSLECLLTRIGVDPAEYTSGPGGTGHIHIFQGGVGGPGVAGPTSPGGSPQSYQALWNSAASLQNYDVVLLSCEGGETEAPNPAALNQYVSMYGGRVFASHFHYAWLTVPGSPFQNYNLGQFAAGSYDTGNINAHIDTSFAQGQALHDWLMLPQINALGSMGAPADQLPLLQSKQNVLSYNSPPVTSWIEAANPPGNSLATPGLSEYFSFDLRNGELTCGRFVYSDLHVGVAAADYGNALYKAGSTTGGIVPGQCNATAKLSPQEAVLEFMLFNLTSCLAPPTVSPGAPVVN